MKKADPRSVTESRLDELLAEVRPHAPSHDVVEETLAWIDGDLENLGGWVPPVRGDRMAPCDVVSDRAALDAIRFRERLPMPSAAAACLVLFAVSTAVAVTETRLNEGGLGYGEVAALDSVLEGKQDRFVTLILEPELPSDRSQRLLAKLRRSVDESPAGKRTIGDRPRTRRRNLAVSDATVRIGDAIAALRNEESGVGLADLLAETLRADSETARGVSPRDMPSGAAQKSTDAIDVFSGTLSTDGDGFALGQVLGVRRERVPEAELLTASPMVKGDAAMAPSAIRQVVDHHRDELRACYQAELRRAPGLRTRLTVRWTVGASGEVLSARVLNASSGWPPLERCVLNHVSTWRFPAPPDGTAVHVHYPIVFRPVEK